MRPFHSQLLLDFAVQLLPAIMSPRMKLPRETPAPPRRPLWLAFIVFLILAGVSIAGAWVIFVLVNPRPDFSPPIENPGGLMVTAGILFLPQLVCCFRALCKRVYRRFTSPPSASPQHDRLDDWRIASRAGAITVGLIASIAQHHQFLYESGPFDRNTIVAASRLWLGSSCSSPGTILVFHLCIYLVRPMDRRLSPDLSNPHRRHDPRTDRDDSDRRKNPQANQLLLRRGHLLRHGLRRQCRLLHLRAGHGTPLSRQIQAADKAGSGM